MGGTLHEPGLILVAEDDPDDREFLGEAFARLGLANPLRFVEHGVELLDYLRREGAYADPASSPRPSLVLLDLNMPVMDGKECLARLRAEPDLRRVPVVVLTTSGDELDIERCYALGANAYVCKPMGFDAMLAVTRGIGLFWFDIARLPAPAA